MQELLCASDMLITDYSSSMFDMTLLGRPCMLYATDAEQYDRGYYFELKQLPYPLARNQEELIRNLEEFDLDRYRSDCMDFDKEHIKSVERGKGSEGIAQWMKEHSI
jgi:CDP-glycerol glycerophosphotransferase